MNKLSLCLKKQRREIERLKQCKIYSYTGFDQKCILVFDKLLSHFYMSPSVDATQMMIDKGHYKSIIEFDGIHSSDIAFTYEYFGRNTKKYHNETKKNLIILGKNWRKRVTKEYPDADVAIIVHSEDGGWCLDTYNYKIKIKGAIYL